MIHYGTDPEFFILDAEGRSVPAHLRLPHKSAPLGVASEGMPRGYFSLFRDGYAAEVNVSPSTTIATMMWKVQAACEALRTFVLKEGERLTTRAGVPVTKQWLVGAPPDVMESGCDPSMDAYTGEQKFPAMDMKTAPDRFAGGHMHFSCAKLGARGLHGWSDKERIPEKVKLLDLYVGLPLTFLFPTEDSFNRRLFYGQAGEFRFQDYGTHVGFEYRVPTPHLWGHGAVASLAFTAARFVLEGSFKWDEGMAGDLQGAINGGIDMEKMLRPLISLYDVDLLKKGAEALRPLVESPGELDSAAAGWREFTETFSHVKAA